MLEIRKHRYTLVTLDRLREWEENDELYKSQKKHDMCRLIQDEIVFVRKDKR